MLFYDMRNPKPEEPKVDIFEEEVLPNVIPKLSTGGDPLQEMQSVMLGGTDERNEQVDQLDIFQDPRNTELPAEVEMANLVFGKAPGWAIAGVNKVDDLLRPGGTGQRIAQADGFSRSSNHRWRKLIVFSRASKHGSLTLTHQSI